jgi:hypothetical protein
MERLELLICLFKRLIDNIYVGWQVESQRNCMAILAKQNRRFGLPHPIMLKSALRKKIFLIWLKSNPYPLPDSENRESGLSEPKIANSEQPFPSFLSPREPFFAYAPLQKPLFRLGRFPAQMRGFGSL